MLQAAIMTGVNNARKNRQASEMAQQAKATKPTHRYASDGAPHRRNTIFEPRPEPTYSDINSFYEQADGTGAGCPAANSRTPVRYIGARTDSRCDYAGPAAGRKLVRRETVIASWKYLKNERERALGIKEGSDVQNTTTAAAARKVSRSHSDRQNGGLKKYSSKRKSVIYTYDPIKKVLNKAYTFESEDSGDESDVQSSASSGKTRVSNATKELADDDFQCKRSSSFTKIKTLFMRVFNNKSL